MADLARIAILGATSHLAKGLLSELSGRAGYDLSLFARVPEKVSGFLEHIKFRGSWKALPLDAFAASTYDAIINSIGVSDPQALAAGADLFFVTEQWDTRVLRHLDANPSTRYIYLSSGAVYAPSFESPSAEDTRAILPVNHLDRRHFYQISKLHAEAKHRALAPLGIYDVRVFAYFSRYQDLGRRFFVSELVRALREHREFVTDDADMVRDYAGPRDLFGLVEKCFSGPAVNGPFDLYSRAPTSKRAILDWFTQNRGLRCRVVPEATMSPTGRKDQYYSVYRSAERLGYKPCQDALGVVTTEACALLDA
jgi:nucleoside-diphosphate-sugar epimerase